MHPDAPACLAELTQIHQFVYRVLDALGDEMLWVGSMPCGLPTDETIPLGVYGSSNVGRAKSVYRMGLGHRYGRRMQTISGIHYNWSMPGVTNEEYFRLIRNFRRHSFLLLTLFGASPAVCSSFVAGRSHQLQTLAGNTLHMPHGTSLRMGRLGYQSDAQSTLAVSYNSLESYVASLQDAMTRPYPAYEAVGIRNPGGDYNQLSTSLLQIENEFYGTIRPKRVIAPASAPCTRCASAASNTSRCAAWTSIRSSPWASMRRRCASSTSSCCTACSATARPTRRRRSPRWRATSIASPSADASRG